MIGLDTNVLVRYMVQDDPEQSAAATQLIGSHCTAEDPGLVAVIVVCEVAWVLQRGYGYDRTQVADVIQGLLSSVEISVERSELVWQALRRFRSGPADLPDFLIGLANAENGAHTTVTFDKKAARDPLFKLLEQGGDPVLSCDFSRLR